MREYRTYTVYDLGLVDYPSEDRKIAVFFDDQKAVEYVTEMGKHGERYGVYDVTGDRIDDE